MLNILRRLRYLLRFAHNQSEGKRGAAVSDRLADGVADAQALLSGRAAGGSSGNSSPKVLCVSRSALIVGIAIAYTRRDPSRRVIA